MLTESQVEFFNTNGYLVVEDLVDQETLENVRAEYSKLMDQLYAGWAAEGKVPPPTPGMEFWDKLDIAFRGGFDWYQPFDISLPHDNITDETPMHFGPAVFSLVRSKKILDAVETLIGSEITSNPIQHVRIKPPQKAVDASEIRAHVVATDWHQDMGVTLPEADNTKFVTVWLAITDATIENGCLQVATGNYKEMLPHCTKKQTGIADQFIPTDKATPLPVKAGGAVIFHPLTPHGSLSNNSDGYRWSFDLRYNVTGQPTGRSHFPEFVARSRSNPENELKDWQEWRQLWSDARYRLARSEHIPQHRWDSNSPYCA
ncbi:Phytanoyl-CoA dioxygenase superfamily protein [Roseibium sp. TrichSKD4]|uniref:phytanoyl-CoA dioxygenase family protein n=1 Tax=Roseibium sp. TrichSKD4 TaxID=744980 RepID=UPI0001E56FAF|nr:phytanoyl-CoA dioxygenase family protein [Roseibium sp. TrichSKD4]EFO32093.1 Phytanoyl-CoA dioxygenase superfamily protein [Roseibium sp. TrichSKD4]